MGPRGSLKECIVLQDHLNVGGVDGLVSQLFGVEIAVLTHLKMLLVKIHGFKSSKPIPNMMALELVYSCHSQTRVFATELILTLLSLSSASRTPTQLPISLALVF